MNDEEEHEELYEIVAHWGHLLEPTMTQEEHDQAIAEAQLGGE